MAVGAIPTRCRPVGRIDHLDRGGLDALLQAWGEWELNAAGESQASCFQNHNIFRGYESLYESSLICITLKNRCSALMCVFVCILYQALSSSSNLQLLEEAARLTNAVASDRMGRSYLLQRDGAGNIPALVAILKAARDASLTGKSGRPEGSSLPQGAQAEQLQGEEPQLSRLQPSPPPQMRPSSSLSRPGSFGRQRTAPAGGEASPLPSAPSPRPSASGDTPAALTPSKATAQDTTGGDGNRQGNAADSGMRDSALLQQSLIALQKMSLRRQAQSAMIREGLLPWLVEYLQASLGPQV